jgi:ribosomal protein S18 acetylase RimI-like enzyme
LLRHEALMMDDPEHQTTPAADVAVRLRPVVDTDRGFLLELFACTREAECRALPDDRARRAFVESQFDLQDHHYRAYYPGARLDVIEVDGAPVGRIYVHRRDDEIRLMEITISPASRRRGIARTLLRGLIAESEAGGLPIGLHVEPDNPANAWYRRLGFRHVVDRGAYEFLLRHSRAARPEEACSQAP